MGAKNCCEGKKLYDLGVDKEMFLKMLGEEPDLSKFQFWDQKTVKELKKLWKSKVYGGHVFQPVGEAPGTARKRQNVLQDQINLF